MVSLNALRQHPRFARFFEVVHPFFWPVIWWTLNAVFRAYDASNRPEFLLGIPWWGQVYIAFEGDLRPDPLTYRPIPRTFRPLTDAGLASSPLTNLEGHSPSLSSLARGAGVWTLRVLTEGALASPQFDSS